MDLFPYISTLLMALGLDRPTELIVLAVVNPTWMAGRATVRFTSEVLFVVGVLLSVTVLFFVATSGVLFS